MAKRKHTAYMTAGEQVAGTAFFVIYLVVLPLRRGRCSAWRGISWE